ncbi:GNAT family N-acetyltransferase [Caulobacter hibisci]|uniref:GNAT family N-acetyltransferase n=1 Tax=Caulobacter hibisci TaxID=2035993 RepID=A0ABS0T124_9CAUL|nr:GNAT family protein [Caulobacter hibisci]MBI1685578.1 GNAT family N-acetyltransferase [Caulobacter hibisci]
MSITLRERDLTGFFQVPFEVYPADSPYVSPMLADLQRYLDPALNPLMRDGGGQLTYFTAYRDHRPIGRLVVHTHPASNARHGTRRCQFGFFDCADDVEAARALFDAAEAFARDQGCDELAGSFNLTAMQQSGVLTGGFDETPYTDMIWGPAYLPDLLRDCGLGPTFPMSTFEFEVGPGTADSLLGDRQRAILDGDGWTWAPIDRRHFKARFEEARQCLNDGFADNPMFVPLSPAEFDFQAGEMMWFIDPRIACLVRYKGEPAGVIICIPDLNPFQKATRGRIGLMTLVHFLKARLRRRRAVIIFYSVKQALHGRGVNGAMLHRVIKALYAGGYRRCGVTWVSDQNQASLRQMEKLGARRLHRLHLFRKALA